MSCNFRLFQEDLRRGSLLILFHRQIWARQGYKQSLLKRRLTEADVELFC